MIDEDCEQGEVEDKERRTPGGLRLPVKDRPYDRQQQSKYRPEELSRITQSITTIDRNEAPPSISQFLEQNHKILTITGVFTAVCVHFSQLISSQDVVITGIIGSALLSGIGFMIVIIRALIALRQSVVHQFHLHKIIYGCIFVSIMYVWFAQITYLSGVHIDDIIISLFIIFVPVLYSMNEEVIDISHLMPDLITDNYPSPPVSLVFSLFLVYSTILKRLGSNLGGEMSSLLMTSIFIISISLSIMSGIFLIETIDTSIVNLRTLYREE